MSGPSRTSPPATSSGSAAPRIVGALGTNLGASQTITFSGVEEVWLLGTLSANLTITLAGRSAGCRCKLVAVQDATGSRTVAFSDGTTSQAVSVNSTAGAGVEAAADCANATDIHVFNPGGSGPQGPTGATGPQGPQGNTGSQGPAGTNGAIAGIQDEGTDLTVRSKLNFIGAAVTASDDAANSRTNVTITASGGASPYGAPLVINRWYTPPGQNTSNVAKANNTAVGVPLIVARTVTIAQIGIYLAVSGSTGAIVRLGVYTDNAGVPGTLVAEANTTGDATLAAQFLQLAISAAVTAGSIYWLVGVQQSASAGNASFKGQSSFASINPYVPVDSSNPTIGGVSLVCTTGFSGALPASAPAASNWAVAPDSFGMFVRATT